MKTINPKQKLNVEAMMSQLLQRKITKPRFRFPLTEAQAEDVLLAAYRAEVAYRQRLFSNDRDTQENIKKLAHYLTADSSKFGLMFCGMCGNGKTTLLYALRSATNYLNDNGLFEDHNTGIRVIDAKELVALSKDYERFRSICRTPMLAIEDMGKEPTEVLDYGNVLSPVIDLLEYRYNEQLFTVITTNSKSEEIAEKYQKRIADRFNEMLEVIVFKNSTYRK